MIWRSVSFTNRCDFFAECWGWHRPTLRLRLSLGLVSALQPLTLTAGKRWTSCSQHLWWPLSQIWTLLTRCWKSVRCPQLLYCADDNIPRHKWQEGRRCYTLRWHVLASRRNLEFFRACFDCMCNLFQLCFGSGVVCWAWGILVSHFVFSDASSSRNVNEL